MRTSRYRSIGVGAGSADAGVGVSVRLRQHVERITIDNELPGSSWLVVNQLRLIWICGSAQTIEFGAAENRALRTEGLIRQYR